MKKILFTLLLTSLSCLSFTQTVNNEIDKNNLIPYIIQSNNISQLTNLTARIDEKNDIVFSVVVDSVKLNKEQIFNRVMSYFAYNYNDSKSVIQVQDKEAGLIIGKGIYELGTFDLKQGNGLTQFVTYYNYSASHILRIDIKDSKVRIIVSASKYDIVLKSTNPYMPIQNNSVAIIDAQPFKIFEPIKTKGAGKKMFQEAADFTNNTYKSVFQNIVSKCINSQLSIQDLLLNKTIRKEAENW